MRFKGWIDTISKYHPNKITMQNCTRVIFRIDYRRVNPPCTPCNRPRWQKAGICRRYNPCIRYLRCNPSLSVPPVGMSDFFSCTLFLYP